jgi:hypothetical protein
MEMVKGLILMQLGLKVRIAFILPSSRTEIQTYKQQTIEILGENPEIQS